MTIHGKPWGQAHWTGTIWTCDTPKGVLSSPTLERLKEPPPTSDDATPQTPPPRRPIIPGVGVLENILADQRGTIDALKALTAIVTALQDRIETLEAK